MSLQVWMPLDGSLRNLGLRDVEVINNGATVTTTGKIGSCYTGTTASQTIVATLPGLSDMLANGKKYSFTCWVKPNTAAESANGWVVKLGANTCGLWWGYNTPRLVWNENNNGKRCANGDTTSWHHIAVVIDKTDPTNTTEYNYVDGVPTSGYESQTWDGIAYSEPVDDTITIYPYYALLNDIRIYDHCLSPKEVKELSKGLVGHWPLNDMIGGENLIIDTVKDYGKSHTSYVIADYNFSESLVEGDTYTISIKINMSSEKKAFCVYHSGGSYAMGPWKTGVTSGVYSYSFTATSAMASQTGGAGHGYARVYVSNNNGTQGSTALSGTANVDWIKIEKGSTATPWTPAPTDDLYSEMGLDDGIIYDTSGYGRNGSVSANPPTVDSDTPRYSVSTKFNGSNNFIMLGRDAMVKDEITVNAWAYMSDWSTYAGRIISCTEGGGWNFEPSSGKISFPIGTGASSNTYKSATSSTTILTTLSAGWHMFTGTYDGLASKIYVDGVLQGTNNAYTTKTPIFYNANNGIFIGAEAAGNQTTPAGNYYNGKLSDIRIYATALSATDIKELYETSASVDNHGNLWAYEYLEG